MGKHKNIYNTQRWQRARVRALACHPLCALCGRPATDVHHVKALEDGGAPFDECNLQCLCHECHARLTQAETATRHGRPACLRGCGVDGQPVDPRHEWNAGAPGGNAGTPSSALPCPQPADRAGPAHFSKFPQGVRHGA